MASVFRGKATKSHSTKGALEASFSKNDVLTDLQQTGHADWYKGRVKGKGPLLLIPSNLVKVTERSGTRCGGGVGVCVGGGGQRGGLTWPAVGAVRSC